MNKRNGSNRKRLFSDREQIWYLYDSEACRNTVWQFHPLSTEDCFGEMGCTHLRTSDGNVSEPNGMGALINGVVWNDRVLGIRSHKFGCSKVPKVFLDIYLFDQNAYRRPLIGRNLGRFGNRYLDFVVSYCMDLNYIQVYAVDEFDDAPSDELQF